jgi:hypothetical protein
MSSILEMLEEKNPMCYNLSFKHPIYEQKGVDNFTTGLSSLDALFNLGVDDAKRLLIETVM